MSLCHLDLPIESCLPTAAVRRTVQALVGNHGITSAAYDATHASVVLDYDDSQLTSADLRNLLSAQGIVPMRNWLRLLLASALGKAAPDHQQ